MCDGVALRAVLEELYRLQIAARLRHADPPAGRFRSGRGSCTTTVPLAGQVTDALRAAIRTGHLPRGERLSAPEVARRIGVSRPRARGDADARARGLSTCLLSQPPPDDATHDTALQPGQNPAFVQLLEKALS